MNTGPIYRRHLRDSARSLALWGLGLVAVPLLYLPLFPSMRSSGLLGDKLAAIPPEMLDTLGMDVTSMATGWGYAHQTVFGMLGMLLLLVLGIATGARAIAGDEESGTLELLLAHATDRTSVLTARLLHVATVVVLAVGLTVAVVAALNGPSELELSGEGLLGEGAALLLLVAFHALLAFAVGALTGRRGLAVGVTSAVAVLGWFAHNQGDKVAEWLPALSPFEWAYGQAPLHLGPDRPGLAALATGAVVFVVIAFAGFLRRDLRA